MKPQNSLSPRAYSLLVLALASALIALVITSQVLPESPVSLSALSSPLVSPLKQVSDANETSVTTNAARPNEVITYTLILSNSGSAPTTIFLTDTIGTNGTIVPGSATATIGTPSITGNTLNWNGTVSPGGLVTITFRVQLTPTVSAAILTNTFNLSYNGTVAASNIVTTTIEPYRAYLPIVRKPSQVFIPIVLRQTFYYAFVPIVIAE